MLHNRAYQLLVITSPLLTLLGSYLVVNYYPDTPWMGLLGLGLVMTLLIYVSRPNSAKDRTRQFARAFSEAPAGLMLLDLEGHVEWVNTALQDIIGQPFEDLQGRAFHELITGEAWEKIQSQRRTLLDGHRLELDGYISTSGGRTVWTRGYASLVRNDWEKPEFIVVQILDLSETQNAHNAVSEAEARLHVTLELATDLVFTLDGQGRIVHTNERASKTLSGDIDGKSIVDFIENSDREEFVNAFRQCKSEPGTTTEMHRLRLLPAGARQTRGATRSVSAKIFTMPGPSSSTTLICRDLTEQAVSQDLLRSSEARFSRIFHSSPDAILIVRRADTLVLDFNDSFSRLLGYTREEAIGFLEVDLNLFADESERRRVVDQLESTGECTDMEARLRTRHGDLVTVEISLRYVEIDGELCTLSIGRDISKRLLAEKALRESEEKFEQVFSQSPDGIVILKQEDLSIYDINRAFLRASEYSREDLLGRSLLEMDVFMDDSALVEATEHLSNHRQFSSREMTFKTKTGKVIQALVSATLVELNEVPCVLCITNNVSDLRAAEEKLRQSEQRFRGAFENSPIGIILLNTDGEIYQANNFAAELLNFEATPLEGTHISRLIPSSDRSQFKEALRNLLSGRDNTLRMEQRLLCRNGLEIWTNLHATMQRTEEGEPLYCIVQIADITEMKSTHSRMERMAFYDTLTDLANRRLFHERLGHAIEHARRVDRTAGLLYLDLDQFKRVNDTLGHEIGDELLQEVASRLISCVRQEDTVGRLGGDEFTVLLYSIDRPADASLVADKILKALRRPLNISGHQLVITTSIGIAIIPNDGIDPNSLMKNADLAMYRAKDHGRNTYQFYSEEMNTNSVRRLRTEYEIRRAMDNNEFELYYQPKVRLLDQRVTGVECLIRWRHPERGILAPVEFIDVAEETGAIVDIGTWVIEEACSTGRDLCNQAKDDIQIAINISPRQFKDPNLVSNIRRSLRESGLDPAMLEIEITETMLMAEVDAAIQTVHKLHELGVRLAIDDFGTGYSSLSYLKKFPIDTVKVDRSFIMDIPESEDDKAITSAVIAMAHRLNMEVVAEGVETKAQLEFLLSNNCEYAQGYLFSKPLPLSNIGPMLSPKISLLHGK